MGHSQFSGAASGLHVFAVYKHQPGSQHTKSSGEDSDSGTRRSNEVNKEHISQYVQPNLKGDAPLYMLFLSLAISF